VVVVGGGAHGEMAGGMLVRGAKEVGEAEGTTEGGDFEGSVGGGAGEIERGGSAWRGGWMETIDADGFLRREADRRWRLSGMTTNAERNVNETRLLAVKTESLGYTNARALLVSEAKLKLD